MGLVTVLVMWYFVARPRSYDGHLHKSGWSWSRVLMVISWSMTRVIWLVEMQSMTTPLVTFGQMATVHLSEVWSWLISKEVENSWINRAIIFLERLDIVSIHWYYPVVLELLTLEWSSLVVSGGCDYWSGQNHRYPVRQWLGSMGKPV